MKVLSINAGSSSLKFKMYQMPEEKDLLCGTFERIGMLNSFYVIKYNAEEIKKEVKLNNYDDAVKYLIEELFNNNIILSLNEIKGIGHRVVHGGNKYSESVIINDNVINNIEKLSSLAPLHNHANIIGIKAFRKLIVDAVQVAVFDTAFYQSIREDNFLYAVPYEWYTNHSVRKYGFHGTSHKYLLNRLINIIGRKDIKIISCHLGNGGSISAVKNGICINTSMGFTPNAGIMMGTRCGDIDVSIISYIIKKEKKSIDEIDNELNKKSGLLGISGISNDLRDIEKGIIEGNKRCYLAKEMYIKSIVDYIAKYYVELNGIDAICFSGGVGENSISIRKQIIEKLAILGIKLDESANNKKGSEALISASDSSVLCYVIPTNEEAMIARETFDFIK